MNSPGQPADTGARAPLAGDSAADEAQARRRASLGVAAALGAYLIWGLSVIYYKWLHNVPASEVIAHRVVWSVIVIGIYLAWRGRLGEVRAGLTNARTAVTLFVTSLLISFNWVIFVWAIGEDRVVEAALGYFMQPLVAVAIGYLLLRETANGAQIVAITLAAIAVAAQTIALDALPWVAVSLALLFAFYGFARKRLTIGSSPGLFIEVLILSPLALGYIFYLEWTGAGHFLADGQTIFLLLLTGPVTAIPLILFAESVRRLRMITVGLIFYINPTVQFLIGAVLYSEPVSGFRLATFILIWIALGIFIWDAVMREWRTRAQAPSR